MNTAVVFDVSGAAYDRFMGRFSVRLAPLFADFAGIGADASVLDVGCGPGALTAELIRRVGPEHVAAADPSGGFVEECRRRLPGVDAREAFAEDLPWQDGTFDASLSQLAVGFMRDASAGVGEMRRVTRRGGTVSVCMWDGSGAMELLHIVHGAAAAIDPEHLAGRGPRRYRNAAELQALFEEVGLADVETAALDIEAPYEGFDDFWAAVLGGAGPVGALLEGLDEDGLARFREEIRTRLNGRTGPFTLTGRAWSVRGRA